MQPRNKGGLGRQQSYRKLQHKFKELVRDYDKYKSVCKKHIDPVTYAKIVMGLKNGKATTVQACRSN